METRAGGHEPVVGPALGRCEAQPPATNGTVPGRGHRRRGKRRERSMRGGLLDRGRQTGGAGRSGGTVIPHARGLPAALAPRALVIPVIQTTFGAVSMATPRAAEAVAAGEAGADRTAVDVAAVAGAADREDRLTAGARGQTARRALSHRLAPTAGAATPRKAPKTCDNPGRASVGRTTTWTRPLRARSAYSGSSLCFRQRTLRDLAAERGPRDGELPAPAGAKAKSRCFAPDAACGRGPYGPFRFSETPGSDSGLNRHDWRFSGELSRFLHFQVIANNEDANYRGLRRTYEAEQLASFSYRRMLSNPSLLEHFRDDDAIRNFWNFPDSTRGTLWGEKLSFDELARDFQALP